MRVIPVKALSNVPMGALTWRRGEQEVLTLVVKATYVLAPGEATLAKKHEPLTPIERPYPDGSSRAPYAPADLVPMKPRADVILVGHAFAPEPRQRSFIVRLAVGDVEKRAEIHPDRHFDAQGTLHEGARTVSVPLVPERSAGGPDTANPLGLRPDVRDGYGRVVVPNVQPPGLHLTSPRDTPGVVVFGPVASTWRARQALAGATLSRSLPVEWDGKELPPDLDPSHFNAAPPDQQTQTLREGEPIRLENLHPAHPEMTTRLPELRPKAFVEGISDAPQVVAMRADTLWIDTSRGICTLTWRGQVALPAGATDVRALVAMEFPRYPLTWKDIDAKRLAADGTPQAPSPVRAAALRGTASVSDGFVVTLPFAKDGTPKSPSPPRPQQPAGGLPFGDGAPPPPKPPAPAGRGASTIQMPVQDAPAPAQVLAPPPYPPPPAILRESTPLPPVPPTPPAPQPSPPPAVPAPIVSAKPPLAPAVKPSLAPAAKAPLDALQPRGQPTEALRLVGFDPLALPRLRKDPRLSPILDALDEAPLDEALDGAPDDEETEDVEERREVLELLARAAPLADSELAAALSSAVGTDGRLIAPLAIVTGEMTLPFDEVEELRATVAAATAHVSGDADARALLALAKEFLATPGLAGLADVVGGLTTRIRETFEKKGIVTAVVLAAHAERALVGRRNVQRRAVFGGDHVRGLLPGASSIPVYVPAAFAARMPAAIRVRVRMIVAVHPAIDAVDGHPIALRAVALAVAAPIPGVDPGRR